METHRKISILMNKVLFIVVSFFICLIIVEGHVCNAGVPQLINYQGVLKDSSANPITGNVDITFTIYDSATGGTALWTETWSGGQQVSVTNGLFSVLLGSVNPISSSVFSATPRYLGMSVGGDPEMTPRQQIVSNPFAMVSQEAVTAQNVPKITYTVGLPDSRLSPADTWDTYTGTNDTWDTTNERKLIFTKQSASSLLKVIYQDTLGYYGSTYQGCRWRLQLDGSTIMQITAADTDTYGSGNYWHMENATRSALVPNIAAGSHTITVGVYRYSSRASSCLAGWNSNGEYLAVEEIFDYTNWEAQ